LLGPDLALLGEAARAAGAIARRHFGTRPRAWEKGAGQGPVSEADLEIDAMLRARLTAARPGYGWLSEESPDDPARLAAADLFVVDPLDGTRAFLDGRPEFAHALAVVRGGRPVAAVVHLPLLGLTYEASAGGGARLNGRPLAAAPPPALAAARLLVGRSQLAPGLWPGGAPVAARQARPALAWRLCLVAEGAYDGTLTFRDVWHWDIAAGALVAGEAGLVVTDRAGAPLRFNTAVPRSPGLVVAPAALHDDLRARMAAPS